MMHKEVVRRLLTKLNEFKPTRPDKMHPRVLKEVTEEILEPLASIFIKSWMTGEVSED